MRIAADDIAEETEQKWIDKMRAAYQRQADEAYATTLRQELSNIRCERGDACYDRVLAEIGQRCSRPGL